MFENKLGVYGKYGEYVCEKKPFALPLKLTPDGKNGKNAEMTK